jgi:hypothetical protein
MGILLKNLIRRRVRRGRLDGSRLARHRQGEHRELENKLQRRIDMVTETAKRLVELGGGAR